MRAAEHASRGPFQLLERRHGLSEIVERGAGASIERDRVFPPQTEREIIILAETTPGHGYHFAQPCLGFFEAL